ncbi:MAG TPA: DNA helicase RecQ [Dongiaceae bacterium]|nr:DNA helicase RecQ [Dongiaceae bacterium]
MTTPAQILHDVFGYTAFRPGQEEIIDLILAGESVLAVMPTGSGKSLCYQIPALIFEKPTIIVSPLKALMDDQVAGLRADGVEAAVIHSGMQRDEQVAEWRKVTSGRAKLLYLAPERLMMDNMLAALRRLDPRLFVVDEAHCISKWGPSFRPEYEQLSRLKEVFPDARIAAFTATADKATRADIAQKLFAGRSRTIVHGFDRPNLRLGVAHKSHWSKQLLAFLADKKGLSGIVYCLSRKFTDEVAGFLQEQGWNAIPYHAGQEAELRKRNQDRFMSENEAVMVATIAFGMGIDKPDIRYVCHLNLPASMEAYYQEIGRAGRDGAPAETLLLYGYEDLRLRRMFIDEEAKDEDYKRREHRRLDALIAYCESAECRRIGLLGYFDETVGPCGNCDNCLNPPTLIDATRQAQMLLSAIHRTGQAFGAGHVIDVLLGAETDKVRERGHDRLPTYGVGKDFPKQYWQSLVRQAVAGGQIAINIAKYGGLQITERGRAILKGEMTFFFRDPGKKDRASRRADRAARQAANADVDAALLARLKELRLGLARMQRVPAYVVFPDATLIEMARAKPSSLDEMRQISGIGPRKLEQFGPAFLELTRDVAAS